MDATFLLAVVVAVTAAVRGVWSPCGLSMLSSITPMTEAGRGYRFRSTATWFTVGGVLGGLTTGLVAAAGAAGVAVLGLSDAVRWGIAGAIASTEVLTKMALYYFHERAWSSVKWGVGDVPPDPAAEI